MVALVAITIPVAPRSAATVVIYHVATRRSRNDHSGQQHGSRNSEQFFHIDQFGLPAAPAGRTGWLSYDVRPTIGADLRRRVRGVLLVHRPLLHHRSPGHRTGDHHRLVAHDRCWWQHVRPLLDRVMVITVTGSMFGVTIMMIIDADPDPQRNIRPGCCKPCAEDERAQG